MPCYHFSSSVPHSADLFGSVTLSAVTGGSCRSLTVSDDCSTRFGAPLGSHVRSAAPPPLSACKTGMVFGGVLCKFAKADVLSSSLCFSFMHWFYANTFTGICKPQKSPLNGDFLIFSPFSGLLIHRENYLWFALITDIAASSATTVRSL